jgi:SAM-dependent methyltransferase
VGCGLGSFLARVSSRRPELQLCATDIDAEAVEATRARVPGVSAIESSAEEIPFPSQSMDIVTAWDVIEHVPDLDRVRSEVMRVLRPRGAFLFVVPVYDGATGPLISRLDKDPTHIHKRPRSFWLEWASDRFEVVDWHGMFRYLLGPLYLHWPTRMLRRASPAIVVACVRPG